MVNEKVMKFCPLCAKTLIKKKIDGKVRLACPSAACGYVFWNNPIPVVGAIVETSQGVVLCHNTQWPEEVFSIITGFLESDESPKEAVSRETTEELGLQVQDQALVGVYPSFTPNQIVLVYHVIAEGEVSLNHELDAFRYYSREELKGWPFGQDKLKGWPFGAGWAIRDWLQKSD